MVHRLQEFLQRVRAMCCPGHAIFSRHEDRWLDFILVGHIGDEVHQRVSNLSSILIGLEKNTKRHKQKNTRKKDRVGGKEEKVKRGKESKLSPLAGSRCKVVFVERGEFSMADISVFLSIKFIKYLLHIWILMREST